MCAVSNVGDYWRDSLPNKQYWPAIQPAVVPTFIGETNPITRTEFDALKRDIEELKKLLAAAKAYDEAVGEPDCETDEKVALIKKLAGLVGVSVEEIFGPNGGEK